MDKFLATIAVLIGIAAYCSTFAYAAFDYTWWVEIDRAQDGRAFVMAMLHVIASVLGIIGFAVLADKAEERK